MSDREQRGTRTLCFVASVLTVLAWAETAAAQMLPAQRNLARPTVSPYLNMGNTANNGGLNYFGQVRPQQQFRAFGTGVQNQLQQVQTQLNAGSTMIDETGRQAMTTTGHSTAFLNTSGYFSTNPQSSGFGGSGGRGNGLPVSLGLGMGGGQSGGRGAAAGGGRGASGGGRRR